MNDDIAAESSKKVITRKQRDFDAVVAHALNQVRSLPADAPVWAHEFRERTYRGRRDDIQAALLETSGEFGQHITSRSRALMILVEVVVFEPWSEGLKWKSRQQRTNLVNLCGRLKPLYPTDLDTVQRALSDLLWELRCKSVTFSGYTGQVLESLPKSLSDAVVAATAWLSSLWDDEDIVVATIKSDLMAQLVVIDAEHDEEKAKRVVESMQERLAQVVEKQRELSARLNDYRLAYQRLSAENRELRKQLLREQERAQLAEVALEAAIDRILTSPLALAAGPSGDD